MDGEAGTSSYQHRKSKTYMEKVGKEYVVLGLTETIRVSEKGQIVIPKEMRKGLGIEKRDELTATLLDGKIVLRKKPANYTEWMRGLGKEIWGGVDATEYVAKERESWQPDRS